MNSRHPSTALPASTATTTRTQMARTAGSESPLPSGVPVRITTAISTIHETDMLKIVPASWLRQSMVNVGARHTATAAMSHGGSVGTLANNPSHQAQAVSGPTI